MPKRTYQPKKKKRKRQMGFRARASKVLKNRRRKGRKRLVPVSTRRKTRKGTEKKRR